jgi:hypothetical protein
MSRVSRWLRTLFGGHTRAIVGGALSLAVSVYFAATGGAELALAFGALAAWCAIAAIILIRGR